MKNKQKTAESIASAAMEIQQLRHAITRTRAARERAQATLSAVGRKLDAQERELQRQEIDLENCVNPLRKAECGTRNEEGCA
jgi:septal ring factor EnvC (AmiA/AmiB activator)